MTPDEQNAPTEPPPYYAEPAPACHCATPTPWESRRYDGTWVEEALEHRTCEVCTASFGRLVTR